MNRYSGTMDRNKQRYDFVTEYASFIILRMNDYKVYAEIKSFILIARRTLGYSDKTNDCDIWTALRNTLKQLIKKTKTMSTKKTSKKSPAKKSAKKVSKKPVRKRTRKVPKEDEIKQPPPGYDFTSSRAAYQSQLGAKAMQESLIVSFMEGMGRLATLKEIQIALRRVRINLPQSTISGRMNDLRERGNVIFTGEYKVIYGYKRKVFELLPADRRSNKKINTNKKRNAILEERVNESTKRGGIIAVTEEKVESARSEDLPVTKIKKPKKEKVPKVPKEKKKKEPKEKKSKTPVLPSGLAQSSFF